jgi:CheY-like chemotaxis protein
MMNIEFSFIVIDDSELDCFVAKKIIERTNKALITKTFHNAQRALEAIRRNQKDYGKPGTIILLDIQMPMMNGFNFIEEFEKLPDEIKKNYMIIIVTILSSKRNPNEIYRILSHGTVNNIIEKPLTKEKLFSSLMKLRSAV